MANRNFKPGAMAIEKGLICLYGRIVVGAAGAITSQDCRGFSAVKVSGAGTEGQYTVILEDNYNALYMVSTNVNDTVAAGEGKFAQITADDVQNGTLEITVVASDDGLRADVADGGILFLELTLKNSTVEY